MIPNVSDTPETSRTAYIRDVLDRTDGRTYTPEQVAERLNVTKDQLGQLARNGAVPGAFKVGGSWRFPADQYEAWKHGWWDPAAPGGWEAWRHQYAPSDNPGL